ncbi:MAG: hypothetical protein HYU51_13865 [Candidatus Rokubacteria bacterium]|nr:hypothetical protein [Candidatus Rokubacteria bacterium]
MKTTWLVALAILAVAVAVAPASAEKKPTQQTVLYELTENAAYFDMAGNPTGDPAKVVRRTATAQLQGYAALGTVLCPAGVLITNPKAQTCTITATGEDDVNVLFNDAWGVIGFEGTVGGTYAVVIDGDNPVDSPEAVVQVGRFWGKIDLSPTLVGIPLGVITGGTVTVDYSVVPGLAGAEAPFTGTFRMPFGKDASGEKIKPRRGKDAFYLDDNHQPFPVGKDERALGYPTVRFEVNF